MNRIETHIKQITTFEFKVFDKQHTDFLYDSTPEQCCNYIWKNYYSSAVITKMTEFKIVDGSVNHIDKHVIKSIVNPKQNGYNGDINERTLQLQKDSIESFKKKHKIE